MGKSPSCLSNIHLHTLYIQTSASKGSLVSFIACGDLALLSTIMQERISWNSEKQVNQLSLGTCSCTSRLPTSYSLPRQGESSRAPNGEDAASLVYPSCPFSLGGHGINWRDSVESNQKTNADTELLV